MIHGMACTARYYTVRYGLLIGSSARQSQITDAYQRALTKGYVEYVTDRSLGDYASIKALSLIIFQANGQPRNKFDVEAK